MLVSYPKNLQILRSYGTFLEEVKNDLEYSQMAFRTADELEEERSQKHAKHNSVKRRVSFNFKNRKLLVTLILHFI